MVWSSYNQLFLIFGLEFIHSTVFNIWFGVYTISWSEYLVWSLNGSANFNIFFLTLNSKFLVSLIFYIQNHSKITNFLLFFSSSSDPLFLEWNTRFTAIPFKVLCDQVWITLCPAMFIILNNFRCGLLANKNDFHIYTIQTIEKLSEFIIFQARKTMLSFTLFISLRFHAP